MEATQLDTRLEVSVRVNRSGVLRVSFEEFPRRNSWTAGSPLTPGTYDALTAAAPRVFKVAPLTPESPVPERLTRMGGPASSYVQSSVAPGDAFVHIFESHRISESEVGALLRQVLGVKRFDASDNTDFHAVRERWGVRAVEMWRHTAHWSQADPWDPVGPWVPMSRLAPPEPSDGHTWERVSRRVESGAFGEASGATAIWIDGWRRSDTDAADVPADDGRWVCRVLWVEFVGSQS
jgi:hypothetical protein